MRENNRKPIEKCRKKLPQFTTMNVIDGQAGLINYSSLIFYSLTIDNILNIIILIILAGISIASLSGQNGILNKAIYAKEEQRGASVQEAKDLWEINNEANEYAQNSNSESLSELLTRLVNEKLLTEDEKDEIIGNEEKGIEATGKVEIGSRTIVFYKASKTLVQAFNNGEIKIGDYLTYKPSSIKTASIDATKSGYSEEQIYKTNMDTTWRVLGLNKDGTELLITSGSPIRRDGDDPYLHLVGVEGYYFSDEILDKICSIYHNSEFASETRSMTIEDINFVLGLTVDEDSNIMYKTNDPSKTALPFTSYFGTSYEYQSTDYAIENYLKKEFQNDPEIQKLETKHVGETIPGSLYMYMHTTADIIEQDSALYNVLFDSTAGTTFATTGQIYEMGFAVRPIISLKNTVTVDDIQVTTGSETVWNEVPIVKSNAVGYIDKGKVE